jgi:AAA15 family ATPase/GTPase
VKNSQKYQLKSDFGGFKMLIEFNVTNYRSIKEKMTFSMVASSSDKTSLPNNLIKDVLKKDNLLRSALIYGANASGKTNALSGINLLKMLILNSANHPKGTGIRFEPFKLDEDSEKHPTEMSVIFLKNKIKYIYEIFYNKERVIYESLQSYESIRPKILFKRYFHKPKTKDISKYNKIHEYYYYFPDYNKKQKEIADKTNENTLYLSKTRTENFKITDNVYEWFNDLVFMGPEGVSEDFTLRLSEESEKYKKQILNALNVADFAIDNFKSESKLIPYEEFPAHIKSFFAQNPTVKHSNKLLQNEFWIYHKGKPFDFMLEESEGTKRMFSIIGPIIDALEKGKVIIFDEFEVKLHPRLNQFILELFHNPSQNKYNSQLIFTTHNTNLLDLDYVRRDQVWFTKKNQKTYATELYSLLEFKPRKDKNIETGYLAGKYGALPFIKKSEIF